MWSAFFEHLKLPEICVKSPINYELIPSFSESDYDCRLRQKKNCSSNSIPLCKNKENSSKRPKNNSTQKPERMKKGFKEISFTSISR